MCVDSSVAILLDVIGDRWVRLYLCIAFSIQQATVLRERHEGTNWAISVFKVFISLSRKLGLALL